ncbi:MULTISPECIES: asparagine synthase (glutamine-hydrolyzing) [Acidobacteriaceae]|uniref:asparagine synthase (glutamine-hydrolyzing) n=1 Tax=Acidobacteriaceae TaxID=204434 RepID=UPI001C204736|nr:MULTISPECIES: asparagine synthase (glutamine-hydrolyzing) [Acidobacteriaceae]MDW5265944.1 asparagine synthase (glutamine-hydrolyzing) [Edaphobacter sp.]
MICYALLPFLVPSSTMCGIAGILNNDGRPADQFTLRRMIKAIGYRGPDDSDIYIEGELGLGHCRLSIIDLAGGHQPMRSPEKDLAITFNGEIFNFIELRESLEKQGHKFLTRSDTEVILHLYRQYGVDCVKHMNGQWAFAIWDKSRKRLFLSRDRLGVRPLYYTWIGKDIVFGSEAKVLLAHPDVRAALDYGALQQVFTYWFALAPSTMFKGIVQLMPGHSLVVENGEATLLRHWALEFGDDDPGAEKSDRQEASLVEELSALLMDATRIRLRADVPVGAYLSGGLDSSITSNLARQCIGSSLHTFSIAFDESDLDESKYQREVAEALGTKHEVVRCSPSEIGAAFADVVWHMETPVLRTAPAPMFMLSRFVHDKGFKVVLTGEGADEFWGGYDIFKEAKVRAYIAAQPNSKRRPLLLKKLYPYMEGLQKQSPACLQTFFHAGRGQTDHTLFSHIPRWELTQRCQLLFSEEVRSANKKNNLWSPVTSALPGKFDSWSSFRRAQYLEAAFLLPDYLLSSQGDRVAMAHSLEGRYPFLDYRLVELSTRVPSRLKMKGLNEKYLLKRAFAKQIPKSVIDRPKQPYRAPQSSSFFNSVSGKPHNDYIAEIISPERIRDFGIFNAASVQKLVDKAKAGRAVSFLDNAALVGIISTQSLVDQFTINFEERLLHESYRERPAAVCN